MILSVIEDVVDDLTVHGHSEQRRHVAVTIGRLDAVLEALGVERDRSNRCQRQSRHLLAVGASLGETTAFPANCRASRFQLAEPAEVLRLPGFQAGLLHSAPQRLVLGRAEWLAVPHGIRAGLKIEEGRQVVPPLPRQRMRVPQRMNGVERDHAQDPQWSGGRRAEEKRQIAQQAGNGHEARPQPSGAGGCVTPCGPGQTEHSTTSRGHLQRTGMRSLTPRLTTSRVDPR